MKERISLTDSMLDAVMKLSEGNPGALTVLLDIVKNNRDIDPDDAFGPLGPLLGLDSHGIYGSRIWMLYKDVCLCSLPTMLALLRSVQLGITADTDLIYAVEHRGLGLDVPDICERVRKRLPAFKLPKTEHSEPCQTKT